MARIELDRVTKRFGDVVAVSELDLEIPDGRLAALLGPSGCGKTTTLRLLSGFDSPTDGEIRFGGQRVNEDPPSSRNLGFVFQNYAIFTHMSVYDNIAFGLRARKESKKWIRQEVERVAELLEITDLLPLRAARLSVNAMQKVALGRSMITNPAIFLLDEPFSNLDAQFRAYMRAELKKLQHQLGQTMVYVTHDQVEAMSLADTIAVMDRGFLQQYGTPEEVYNRPRNRFVAHFIGSTTMNFIPVTAENGDGHAVLRLPIRDSRPIEAKGMTGIADARARDATLTLGIRPEHIALVDATNGGYDLRGSIFFVEPLGSKTIVHLEASERTIRIVVPATATVSEGDNVGVVFDRSLVHVFDDSRGGVALR
jgi:multiple sugar transport system ATP-binding protein